MIRTAAGQSIQESRQLLRDLRESVRVLTADDDSVVCTGLEQILSALPDLELVGSAENGAAGD